MAEPLDARSIPFLILLILGVVISIRKKKLTPFAAFTGAICATLIYDATQYAGFLMLTMFFVTGTIATAIGRKQKEGLERGESTQRKYGQVIANAGMATILAVLAIEYPDYQNLCIFMLAGSLASATSDTLSSELGTLYGKKFYNCLTWKKDQKGLDGVVSLEGTLAGIVGGTLIAVIYAIAYGWNINFILIIIAATIGNFMDSIFGATLERRKILTNDAVNFLSTLFAAGFCLLTSLL